jgi:hypothetical protein
VTATITPSESWAFLFVGIKSLRHHRTVKSALVLFVLLNASIGKAQDLHASCKVFVNDVYRYYQENDQAALLYKKRPDYFTDDLLKLLKKVDTAAAGEAGLDFDYLSGNQDPADRYLLGRVAVTGNRCSVEYFEVRDGIRGREPAAIPELLFSGNKWRITNIRYSDNQDLRTLALRFLNRVPAHAAEERVKARTTSQSK